MGLSASALQMPNNFDPFLWSEAVGQALFPFTPGFPNTTPRSLYDKLNPPPPIILPVFPDNDTRKQALITANTFKHTDNGTKTVLNNGTVIWDQSGIAWAQTTTLPGYIDLMLKCQRLAYDMRSDVLVKYALDNHLYCLMQTGEDDGSATQMDPTDTDNIRSNGQDGYPRGTWRGNHNQFYGWCVDVVPDHVWFVQVAKAFESVGAAIMGALAWCWEHPLQAFEMIASIVLVATGIGAGIGSVLGAATLSAAIASATKLATEVSKGISDVKAVNNEIAKANASATAAASADAARIEDQIKSATSPVEALTAATMASADSLATSPQSDTNNPLVTPDIDAKLLDLWYAVYGSTATSASTSSKSISSAMSYMTASAIQQLQSTGLFHKGSSGLYLPGQLPMQSASEKKGSAAPIVLGGAAAAALLLLKGR